MMNNDKKESDSRVYITMYHTGSISGVTVPAVLFIEGKTCRRQYIEKWLMKNGAAVGSTIIMTLNVFMTEETQGNSTPHICHGIRQADPIVIANPQ